MTTAELDCKTRVRDMGAPIDNAEEIEKAAKEIKKKANKK